MERESHWLSTFDLNWVRRSLGARTFDNALTSAIAYAGPPALTDDAVRASLGDVTVSVRVDPDDRTLMGDCSRCSWVFGPCLHAAIVAIDLAASAELREALLSGDATSELAVRAPDARRAIDLELKFDGALRAWLAPTEGGMSVEIAATPFADVEPYVGRGYGDAKDEGPLRVLSLFVRRTGERKLLTPKEMLSLKDFAARDRRVLEHARDRGSARKAVHAVGTFASLTIEAMRAHGGILTFGHKDPLDFREAYVRPIIALTRAGAPFDALQAHWVVDASGARIPVAESVFFAGPFPYVWTRDGAIYRVAPDVDLDFAAQLARAPALYVPATKLKETGARLLVASRGRGITVPSPPAFGLAPVETPRIFLRLGGDPLEVRAELCAAYRKREHSLFESSPRAAGAEEGRDLDCEIRALDRVTQAGIGPLVDDEGRNWFGVTDEAAVDFWQRGLIPLRESKNPPLEIELEKRLANVRVGAPVSGKVHVALEGNWLKTRLEFRSEDLTVEMGIIRRAIAKKQRWVALKDGTLARLSSAVTSLAAESMEVMGKDALREGSVLLPPHQLGRLDRWLEENDGKVDEAVRKLRQRLRALAVNEEPAMPKGLRGTLRPYQRLGLAWLQFLQALGAGGVLADDMGLGKTITTLAFLLRRREKEGRAPSLVVCPTSVAQNWILEAKRFTPRLRVRLLHGPSRASRGTDLAPIRESDLVVTTYALLRRDLETLSKVHFRCVVLDEAQNIKNADSASRRAAAQLDTSMRIALTGTPMENRLRELWSIVTFANPGILGTVRSFETRFERPLATDRKSPIADELRAVVRPFLLRRTKNEVLRELPPKTEIDRFVTLEGDDRRMYDALAHTMRDAVRRKATTPALHNDDGRRMLSVFAALMRLRQMACDPRLIDKGMDAAPSAKRQAFLELVRELAAEGRRALVFSQFVELLTLWRRDLDEEKIAYEYLDGSTQRRDQVVERFQTGTAPLFLISLKAGGSGLNLTAADTVIHCDPWWNPAVEDQATDRAHRIGQDKSITVVRLIARGTIEDKVLSLKAIKRELVGAVIDDNARALTGLTEDDIELLLGDVGEREDERDETDQLATATKVLDPEFFQLVEAAKWWLSSTGRFESDLAEVVEIPSKYAARLARGEPFPCSRAVAERVRIRLRDWR